MFQPTFLVQLTMQNMKSSLYQIKIMNLSGIRSHEYINRCGPSADQNSFEINDLVKIGTNAKIGARKET